MLENKVELIKKKHLSRMMRKTAQLLFIVCIATGLFACHNTSHTQDQLVIEMEMDEGYSPENPMNNARLFQVIQDTKVLNVEIVYQMNAKSGDIKILDRNTDQVLWKKEIQGNIDQETMTITLHNLKKDTDYALAISGTDIKSMKASFSFGKDMVEERERPSKK